MKCCKVFFTKDCDEPDHIVDRKRGLILGLPPDTQPIFSQYVILTKRHLPNVIEFVQ